MPTASPEIIRWVSCFIVPQEPLVRASLRRAGVSNEDADDLIQEAYCQFAAMRSTEHVARPGAYFMQTVKNIHRDELRRSKLIRFEDITENASLFVEDRIGVEAMVAAREQLRLVDRLLAALPERCRSIFTLKRVEGLSQREIAKRLGVTENVVENDVQKALRVIQRALQNEHLAEDQGQVVEGRGYEAWAGR